MPPWRIKSQLYFITCSLLRPWSYHSECNVLMSSIFSERSSQPVFFGYCFQTHSGSRKHILVHIFMGFAISRYLALNKPVLSLKVVFWIIHNGFNRVVATPQSHSSSQKEARHIPSHILRAWGPDPNPSETPVTFPATSKVIKSCPKVTKKHPYWP